MVNLRNYCTVPKGLADEFNQIREVTDQTEFGTFASQKSAVWCYLFGVRIRRIIAWYFANKIEQNGISNKTGGHAIHCV